MVDRHRSVDITDQKNLAGHRPNTTLLIIAPRREPSAEELAAYRGFLNDGNTIFLADDFGNGNAILAGIGSRIRILKGTIASLDRSWSDPCSVIVYRTAEESPFPLPGEMVLNGAAPLEGGSPLMLTSIMSWTDANGDRRLNLGEEMGTFPAMATEPVGAGTLIVLSDPSIFINSMYLQEEAGNNRDMIRALVTRDGPVLIDQMNSRTAGAGGLSEILHVIRNTVMIEIFLLAVLMLCIAWAWKTKQV